MVSDSTVDIILKAAVLAPSADNSQPFKFSFEKDQSELSIWIDLSRSGGYSDQGGFLTYMALGTAIKNIEYQAQFMGIKTTTEILTQIESESPIAKIVLAPDSSSGEATLAPEIEARCTDRRFPYQKPAIEIPVERLNKIAEQSGCSIKWLNNSDKTLKNQVIRLAQESEALRFSEYEIHEELMHSIDFNNHFNNQEGLPLKVLHLDPMGLLLIRWIRSWRVLNTLNKIKLNRVLGFFGAGLAMRLSPTLALLSADSYQPKSLLQAGYALQGVWLELTKAGLSAHPYASLGVLSSQHVTLRQNAKGQQDLRKEAFQITKPYHPIIILRIGSKKGSPNRTGRRPVLSFMK